MEHASPVLGGGGGAARVENPIGLAPRGSAPDPLQKPTTSASRLLIRQKPTTGTGGVLPNWFRMTILGPSHSIEWM